MPILTYLTPDGARHVVDAPYGQTVMEASIRNNLPGIIADCGGNMSCATCHVYVEDEFAGCFEPPSEEEQDMLDFTEKVTKHSRLSCQLVVNDACEGITVEVVGP